MQSNFVKITDSNEEINDFLLRKQYCYASLQSKIKALLTHMTVHISTSISHRPLKRLHNTVHALDSKSSKFYSLVYNRNEDILHELNRKHIFNPALCNDQITSAFWSRKLYKRRSKIMNSSFQWKRNTEGLLCNLSSIYAGGSSA